MPQKVTAVGSTKSKNKSLYQKKKSKKKSIPKQNVHTLPQKATGVGSIKSKNKSLYKKKSKKKVYLAPEGHGRGEHKGVVLHKFSKVSI